MMHQTQQTHNYVRPWLYPAQQAAVFASQRYAVVEASTKAGKTVACMTWILEQAISPEVDQQGRNYWWIAPVYPQAQIAFRRLKRGLPPEIIKPNESALTLSLPNGAVIWFKSAEKPDNLYGEDVYAAVIDEATRCREDAWYAIRSTLTATHGPVRIIGNVKGRRNWAYQLARKAEAGEPGMHYAKLTAHDAVAAGVLSQAEIDDARQHLPENVFKELYLAEPSDDDGNPFGVTAIRACVAPLSQSVPIAWGWDLAKSVDWTVGVALDAAGVVCRFERWQGPWDNTKMRIKAATGVIPALVDSTGVGDPVLEDLQKDFGSNYAGFKFSAPSKQQLMEGLAVAIQQRTIRFPDGPIVTELESFEFEYTRTGVRYGAPEGSHDDCVCALALAVQHARTFGRGKGYSMNALVM